MKIRMNPNHYNMAIDFMHNQNYSIIARKFNISATRVRQIHEALGLRLKKHDAYMKFIFNYETTFSDAFKKHPHAIKECFYRLVIPKE